MKIFAFNLGLELRLDQPSEHFSWQPIPLEIAVSQLQENGPDFPDQVFYIAADSILLDAVVHLLQDENMAQQRARLIFLFPTQEALDAFKTALPPQFKPEVAAGGLVTNPQGELLMIHRLGKWDLPKGKLEAGETIATAAWREVEEETGLQGHLVTSHLVDTFHVFKRKVNWKFKVTHWYAMRVDTPQNLVPQTEEGITAVKWWSRAELVADFPDTYPLIQDLLRDALGNGFFTSPNS